MNRWDIYRWYILDTMGNQTHLYWRFMTTLTVFSSHRSRDPWFNISISSDRQSRRLNSDLWFSTTMGFPLDTLHCHLFIEHEWRHSKIHCSKWKHIKIYSVKTSNFIPSKIMYKNVCQQTPSQCMSHVCTKEGGNYYILILSYRYGQVFHRWIQGGAWNAGKGVHS